MTGGITLRFLDFYIGLCKLPAQPKVIKNSRVLISNVQPCNIVWKRIGTWPGCPICSDRESALHRVSGRHNSCETLLGRSKVWDLVSFEELCCTVKLTPRSRVLPEKLPGPQLVSKFPALYGTQTFGTAFTKARHLSLSSARSIQSMSIPLLEDLFLILFCHPFLNLKVASFLQVSPPKPCTHLSSLP